MSGPYDFASDNTSGVHPDIFDALYACDVGPATPYGADKWSEELDARFSEMFEHDAYVFPVPTGTAANGLALGAISPSYGAIFCQKDAHIVTTECGAPEFYTSGARLILLNGHDGKIQLPELQSALTPYAAQNRHHLRASALSLTQATETGTVYTCNEIGALCQQAHDAGMKVHMDGARFSNAVVKLGCSAAEMTWKSGVDIVSFGVTKNGGMNTEAVVTFDAETALTLRYLHKRAGLLNSKMRYSAAQLLGFLKDDLWLRNASQANVNCSRLSGALAKLPGVRMEYPVETNQIFVHLPKRYEEIFRQAGLGFRNWVHPDGDMYRLVAAFDNSEGLVRHLEVIAADIAG